MKATMPSVDEARKIMGQNFVYIAEAQKVLRRAFTEEELAVLSMGAPFSIDALRECADTHVLFPGAPVAPSAFLDVHSSFPMWQGVVASVPDVRWYLVRKQIDPASVTEPSTSKLSEVWVRKVQFIGRHEERPRSCEVALLLHLWNKIHGEWIYPEGVAVLNADRDAQGRTMTVRVEKGKIEFGSIFEVVPRKFNVAMQQVRAARQHGMAGSRKPSP